MLSYKRALVNGDTPFAVSHLIIPVEKPFQPRHTGMAHGVHTVQSTAAGDPNPHPLQSLPYGEAPPFIAFVEIDSFRSSLGRIPGRDPLHVSRTVRDSRTKSHVKQGAQKMRNLDF